MFHFLTGDILESTAECLINTVNCEGYMGKGIAYQFKLRFPENNRDYIRACKDGSFKVGTLHHFYENGKVIINFPTKDKWRQKSKLEYIHRGMDELKNLVHTLGIKTIAIPPLGCGNGGLNWNEVKPILIDNLKGLSEVTDIYIYEPSKYFKSKSTEIPRITTSHYILMLFKSKLKKFTKLRLQKTAFFMNIYLKQDYFKFDKHKFGPYSHAIDILSRTIKEFQSFYNVNTNEAIILAKNILTSKQTDKKVDDFSEAIEKAVNLTNKVMTDKELEILATVLSIVKDKVDLTQEAIINEVLKWSKEKAEKFTQEEIVNATAFLIENNIIYINILGRYNLH